MFRFITVTPPKDKSNINKASGPIILNIYKVLMIIIVIYLFCYRNKTMTSVAPDNYYRYLLKLWLV